MAKSKKHKNTMLESLNGQLVNNDDPQNPIVPNPNQVSSVPINTKRFEVGDMTETENGTRIIVDSVNNQVKILDKNGDHVLIDIKNGAINIGKDGETAISISKSTGKFIVYAANGIRINGEDGVDGNFTDPSGNTITVTKGIITAITPP